MGPASPGRTEGRAGDDGREVEQDSVTPETSVLGSCYDTTTEKLRWTTDFVQVGVVDCGRRAKASENCGKLRRTAESCALLRETAETGDARIRCPYNAMLPQWRDRCGQNSARNSASAAGGCSLAWMHPALAAVVSRGGLTW